MGSLRAAAISFTPTESLDSAMTVSTDITRATVPSVSLTECSARWRGLHEDVRSFLGRSHHLLRDIVQARPFPPKRRNGDHDGADDPFVGRKDRSTDAHTSSGDPLTL